MMKFVPIRVETSCDDCGEDLYRGNTGVEINSDIFCEDCAKKKGVICECGKLKLPESKMCRDCQLNGKDDV